ncbi:MAG: tyrosine-type recombinase/integrase [Candidatus Saccharimonadales bacterium]
MRLSDGVESYLQAKSVEGYSPYTLRAYGLQFRLLGDWLDDPALETITTQQLRDYIAKDLDRLKPASTGHRIRAIHSLFRWLVDEEILARDPSAKVKERGTYDRIPKALSEEQVETLRDACRTPRERALVEFFFATGARLAEVCRLNRADLDFERRSVVVLGKGSREREVYFGHKCAFHLRRYLDGRADSDPALFATLHRPYVRAAAATIRHEIKKIAARVGLEAIVSPHKWRHTLATSMLNRGADLMVIQSILGHERPGTTLLYLKLSGRRRQEQHDRYFMQ